MAMGIMPPCVDLKKEGSRAPRMMFHFAELQLYVWGFLDSDDCNV